jgi:hypothetical protein
VVKRAARAGQNPWSVGPTKVRNASKLHEALRPFCAQPHSTAKVKKLVVNVAEKKQMASDLSLSSSSKDA